ncbi:MAG: class I SAM-dependent methyltransferase [Planctomycetota bacterium]|nr:class I SAM-dependent methyltransferase [Planctomycetota bacterium]
MESASEFPEHAAENRRIWDANARWWDDQIGDGNAFQDVLIEPATEGLLEARKGDCILDIACGAGRLARRLARLGANVVGFDYSAAFIERARERGEAEGADVEYHVLDAADPEALLYLGAGRFDRAVCSMALMDMPRIEPLFGALATLLKPEGCFVFSISHPCFHSAAVQRFVELAEEHSGRHQSRKGVKVWSYLTPQARKTEGIIGQPEPQYLFHRPLHAILNAGFRAGFVVDGLEEPGFPAEAVEPDGLRWIDMIEIPPAVVVRMRRAARA